jgi:hypothetical protein
VHAGRCCRLRTFCRVERQLGHAVLGEEPHLRQLRPAVGGNGCQRRDRQVDQIVMCVGDAGDHRYLRAVGHGEPLPPPILAKQPGAVTRQLSSRRTWRFVVAPGAAIAIAEDRPAVPAGRAPDRRPPARAPTAPPGPPARGHAPVTPRNARGASNTPGQQAASDYLFTSDTARVGPGWCRGRCHRHRLHAGRSPAARLPHDRPARRGHPAGGLPQSVGGAA